MRRRQFGGEMKRSLFLLITIVVTVWLGCSSELRFSYELNKMITIMRGREKAELTSEQFLKEVSNVDVIFVGEIHSDSATHIFEYELLQILHTKHKKYAVALEMFERDDQEILNKYLAGRITEKEFLKNVKFWSNYKSSYRLLVEFAKTHKLPVLAMNVPRSYANQVALGGEQVLYAIPDSEKVWMARELKCFDDAYKENFMEQMSEKNRPLPMLKFDMQNLYKAQCLKDDTMAETISDFLEKNPGCQVIAFQGVFHVANGLGLAQKLHLLKPEINQKIAVCIPVDNLSALQYDTYQNKGDYLVFISDHK